MFIVQASLDDYNMFIVQVTAVAKLVEPLTNDPKCKGLSLARAERAKNV